MAQAALQLATFVPSSRGGQLLLIMGYLYRLDKKTELKAFYKCRREGCNARAIVEGRYVSHTSGEHRHAIDETEAQRMKFVQHIKNECTNNNAPMPQVYRQAIAMDAFQANPATLPTFGSIKDAAYRARHKNFPPLPATRADYIVDPETQQTLRVFDINGGTPNRIVGFSSNQLIRALAETDRLQIDGTFNCVPNIFEMLTIIHGKVLGVWEPLAFFLMPNKQQVTYEAMWHYLHDACRQLTGHYPMCNYFLADFELASIAAISGRWPVHPPPTIKGCLFHFNQAVLRNTQRLGLQIAYQQDPDVQKMVRRLMALPLVQIDHLDEAFTDVIMADMPEPGHAAHQNCHALLDYFLTTWLQPNARYNRQMWNHFNEDADRTINAAESRHHALNSISRNHRLNVHEFVKELRVEIVNAETRIQQRAAGTVPPQPRLRARQLANALVTFRWQFLNGQRNLRDYLDACSYTLHDAVV